MQQDEEAEADRVFERENSYDKVLEQVRLKCQIVRAICFVVVGVYVCICGAALFAILGDAESMSEVLSIAGYAIAHSLLMSAMLVFFAMLFGDVVESDEVFSEKQADRLRAIALLALASFAVDLLQGFGAAFQLLPAMGVMVDVNNGMSVSASDINIGMLVFSAIMYSLSVIFRYAALLQQLSDDTV
ncbi:hypothetical protein [uncultured Adlercreutzia sp.]|uniref:hypothetical protein n=1 Tax=uncultured Adlercreutzia sp. TaxID=875803 RepID=UPI0025FE9F24|nr:hypothetical protein [uncultured Adlercreutzia sp.]